jgi:Pvc16 N-terminal domain
MSNALAIATISACLREQLHDELSSAPGLSNPGAFTQRPGGNHPGVNAGVDIFLYRVSPSPSWRNKSTPTRDATGRVIERPILGLTLRYLIASFGPPNTFDADIALGVALTHLHTNPTLTRSAIADVLTKAAAPGLSFLNLSDLQLSPELVKFTILPSEEEDITKVWAMQTQGTVSASAVIEASVVLLEPTMSVHSPLPVLERAITVSPGRQPSIARVQSATTATSPITTGSVIEVLGFQLRHQDLVVEIDGSTLAPSVVKVISDASLQVSLPSTVKAGNRILRVIHRLTPGPPAVIGAMTNPFAFLLRPTFTALLMGTNIQCTVTPELGMGQTIEALFTSSNGTTFGVAGLRTLPNQAEVPTAGIPTGTYLLRLRVDGAESIPHQGPGGIFDAPTVTIP